MLPEEIGYFRLGKCFGISKGKGGPVWTPTYIQICVPPVKCLL